MIFFSKKKIIIIFIIIITFFSLTNTIYKSLQNGCDFQWQPALLMWNGINHYEKFILQNNYDFLCQGGQYAHLLHVILFPFTLLDWQTAKATWLVVNLFFAFSIPILINKFLNISNYKSILLIAIFLTCYPTRMSLNYGQQSLFVLFFLLISIFSSSKTAVFFSGFSSIKYSTGYILYLNYLVSRNYKNLIISSIPYLLGWIIYFSFTDSNWLTNFFEPLKWILQSGYARTGDLYSFLQFFIFNSYGGFYSYVLLILIFILNIILISKINQVNIFFLRFSLILFCPLIFFPHSNYDYVLLFPLLSYSVMKINFLINKINVIFILYFFYFNRIVKHLLDIETFYQLIMLLLMVLIVILNIYSYNNKNKLVIFNKVFFDN